MKSILVAALAIVALSGCSRNLSSDVYSSSATVGKVFYGAIVSARPVTIKENDRLQDNDTGILGGALAGGVAAGSTIGKGDGAAVAAVGGALVGAALGAVAEDQLGTTTGYEYIVQLDAPTTPVTPQGTNANINLTAGGAVAADMNRAMQMQAMQTQTVMVLQQDATPLQPGQRVMVVYQDDRARVRPMQ
jgi:outer membrane lipoprotein SlyB